METPPPAGRADAAGLSTRLLEIVNSSWMSQATYVAARLGLADHLAAGPRSAADLAHAVGADAPSLQRLLRALATLDLCRARDDGRFELTAMGSLLRADDAASLRAWTVYAGGTLWPLWGNLLHSVTTGESARSLATGGKGFDELERDPPAADLFNRAMVELTRIDAATIAGACPPLGGERIVDVGGGWGELLAACCSTVRTRSRPVACTSTPPASAPAANASPATSSRRYRGAPAPTC
jgi:hypothetical protein